MNAQVRPRRRIAGWVLFIGFVVIPIIEIAVLIQVGQVIGPWWTILLLIASGVLGSYLITREGRKAWRGLREALNSGRMPAKELADAGLILIGGTLMLTPGFVTDVTGALLALPFTRPVARKLLTQLITKRLLVSSGAAYTYRPGQQQRPPQPGRDQVVEGEVIDPDDYS